MKAKSCLMALVVLVSTTAFASDPEPRVAVIGQQKAGLFKVIYEGKKAGNVKLNIYDGKGVTVYSQVTASVTGFIQPVNFKYMEPGEYTIEVIDGDGPQARKIVYNETKSIKNVHVAKLTSEGKYLLAVPNEGEKAITVSIFDGEKNLVHTENRTINGSFGLVYNLQNVSGVPTFEIKEKN